MFLYNQKLESLRICILLVSLIVSGCVTVDIAPDQCPPETQKLPGCPPPEAVTDPQIQRLYELRTWVKPDELEFDPIKLGKQAEISIQNARTKFVGSDSDDALNSLAVKIWMIENARHTIDLVYYIFKPDLIGQAILGALCKAVRRGVDVRIMVDSIGSISLNRSLLKALETCEFDAGFMINARGEVTIYRARVQTVIFNAMSNVFVNHNRRSHDKLLIADGHFPGKAIIITGGRNISLDYYGINADGSPNPDTYNDAELILRDSEQADDRPTVGEVTEIYYTALSLFKNNKRIRPSRLANPRYVYLDKRQQLRQKLEELKSMPLVRSKLEQMPVYMNKGFLETKIRLAHEFGNLISKEVVTDALANMARNPNSIMGLLFEAQDQPSKVLRIVSPYLFAARYYDRKGNVLLDEAQDLFNWLEANPDSVVELVTNSVLTSDNVFAQSIVDMDMAPRLLLSEDMRERWLDRASKSELNPKLLGSDDWQKMVNHPRIFVYETGRIDDKLLGGSRDYGKMHSKYMVEDDSGFVGTANFDYRSRLFNNEMGFFFSNKELADELHTDFNRLVEMSYRWGSPEWLEMRNKLRQQKGFKAWGARNQRGIYRFLRGTGLHWLF